MDKNVLTIPRLHLRLLLNTLDTNQAGFTYKQVRWLDTFAELTEAALDDYIIKLDDLERTAQKEARAIRANTAIDKDVKETMLGSLQEGYVKDVNNIDATMGSEDVELQVPKNVFNFVYDKWNEEDEEVDLPDRTRVVRAKKFVGGRAARKLRQPITKALDAAKEKIIKAEDEEKD